MTITIKQGYDNIVLSVDTIQEAAAVVEAIMPHCIEETSFTIKEVVGGEEEEE